MIVIPRVFCSRDAYEAFTTAIRLLAAFVQIRSVPLGSTWGVCCEAVATKSIEWPHQVGEMLTTQKQIAIPDWVPFVGFEGGCMNEVSFTLANILRIVGFH
jgi:hypothetical protein